MLDQYVFSKILDLDNPQELIKGKVFIGVVSLALLSIICSYFLSSSLNSRAPYTYELLGIILFLFVIILFFLGYFQLAKHLVSILGFTFLTYISIRPSQSIIIYTHYFLALLWVVMMFNNTLTTRLYWAGLVLALTLSVYLRVFVIKLEDIPEHNSDLILQLALAVVFHISIISIFLNQQKLTEQAIVNKDRRYRLLADHTKDLICVHDLDGKYKYVSPSINEMAGYRPEELIGKNPYDFFHPDDIKNIVSSHELCIEQGYSQVSYRFLTNSGAYKWVETISRLIENKDETVLELYTSTRDISDRAKIELMLSMKVEELEQKNEELEKYIESNSQLEHFAYIASHDLRQPILTNIGYATALKKHYENKLDARGKIIINNILKANESMNDLVINLLSYSRVNASQLKVELIETQRMIEELLEENSALILQQQVEVHIDNIPHKIMGSKIYLKQLLQNLFNNAVKFRHKDRPPIVKISAKKEGAYWIFQVKDNGIGISSNHFEKIFLLFQRLHQKNTYEGFGLGLAICKKIVHLHEGNIWVESVEGVGSTFFFSLPMNLR